MKEEEAGGKGEVEEERGNGERGGKGRSGKRWKDKCKYYPTFCACMFFMYHVPQLPFGII